MNDKPIIHASFKSLANPIVTKNNGDTYELELIQKSVAKVMKGVMEEGEKVLYEAMQDFAKREKFTDIYLIDEDFLRSAIENEIKRRRGKEWTNK